MLHSEHFKTDAPLGTLQNWYSTRNTSKLILHSEHLKTDAPLGTLKNWCSTRNTSKLMLHSEHLKTDAPLGTHTQFVVGWQIMYGYLGREQVQQYLELYRNGVRMDQWGQRPLSADGYVWRCWVVSEQLARYSDYNVQTLSLCSRKIQKELDTLKTWHQQWSTIRLSVL
jgi:hypothetical protein